MLITGPSDSSNPPRPQKPLFARSGWEIPQPDQSSPNPLYWIPRMSSEKMTESAKHWLNHIGGITVRSVSNYPYDCVGMIFGLRRVYIEIEHIYDILRHDG